jgi:hypothetical protein
MDEARLLEKLRAIEALFAGATTQGTTSTRSQAGSSPKPSTRIHRMRATKLNRRSSVVETARDVWVCPLSSGALPEPRRS